MSAPLRAAFDSIAMNCITKLESYDEVASVDFAATEGALQHDVTAWEKRNMPYILPADLKSFYSIMNGFQLSYRVECGGKLIPVGGMSLNRLDAITRVPVEGYFPQLGADATLSTSSSSSPCPDLKTSAAFSIDSSLDIGDVVLLYRNHSSSSSGASSSLPLPGGPFSSLSTSFASLPLSPSSSSSKRHESSYGNPYEDPEVWFQDISARWHFVSPTFTHFLRVMVVHVGIYGWQLAFTPEGLPTTTQHWMGLFCKERLCVDLHRHQQQHTNASRDV